MLLNFANVIRNLKVDAEVEVKFFGSDRLLLVN